MDELYTLPSISKEDDMTKIADWVPEAVKARFTVELEKGYPFPQNETLLRLLSDENMRIVFEKLEPMDKSKNLATLILFIEIAAEGTYILKMMAPIKKVEIKNMLRRIAKLADSIDDTFANLDKAGIRLPEELTNPLALVTSVGAGDLFSEELEDWCKETIHTPPPLSSVIRRLSTLAVAASEDEPEYIFEGEVKIKGFNKFGGGLHERRNYIAHLSGFLKKNFDKYFDNEVAAIVNIALNPEDGEFFVGPDDVAKIRHVMLSKAGETGKEKES